MDLQSSPSIATLRTALDVPEGTLIGNHHRVLIQRTRGLIHTVKFVSKPRPGTCVAFAFGLSNDLRITGTSGARNRRSLMRRVRFRP